jgi:hypothetical protein
VDRVIEYRHDFTTLRFEKSWVVCLLL